MMRRERMSRNELGEQRDDKAKDRYTTEAYIPGI